MDLDYQLTPGCDLVLCHTAFGGFCVRARNDGESWYSNPEGAVTLPDPHYSVPELNWPASDWSAYAIKLTSGKTLGVALLDHPANPPATWHNPRYVWMVNPCIVAGKPVMLDARQPFHLRYRLVIHDGPTPIELVKELNREWRKAGK
jgi:hypothetical protein